MLITRGTLARQSDGSSPSPAWSSRRWRFGVGAYDGAVATTLGIVWNPSKGDKDELASAAVAAFDRAGVAAEFLWFETTKDDPGQGPAAAALAAGCDTIVAAGGDGTVRAVAEKLAGTGVSVGIVPQGTGNLLARNLEIPIADPRAAFHRVATASPRSVDMGWVEVDTAVGTRKHGFVVMAGFGVDARMLNETDDELKAKIGWMAYAEAMGRALTASELVDFTLSVNGATAARVKAHTMLIGNCGTIQGGMRILPDARPDDGVLDVLMVSAAGVGEWLGALKTIAWDNGLKRLFAGGADAESTDFAEYLTVTELRVELAEPQPFEIDGDEVGDVRGFSVTVQPGALSLR